MEGQGASHKDQWDTRTGHNKSKSAEDTHPQRIRDRKETRPQPIRNRKDAHSPTTSPKPKRHIRDPNQSESERPPPVLPLSPQQGMTEISKPAFTPRKRLQLRFQPQLTISLRARPRARLRPCARHPPWIHARRDEIACLRHVTPALINTH